MSRRTRNLFVVVAAACALITLLISVLPFASFAYRSVQAHMAIETAAALTTALAAVLVYGRFAQTGRRSDLVLFAALLLFAGTNLAFSVVPPIVGIDRGGGFATWAPVIGRLASATVFGWAAFAADVTVADRVAAVRRTAALVVAGLVLIAAVIAPLAGVLPSAIDPGLSPESSGRPRIVGDPVVLAAQFVAMVLFAAAAYGFLRRAERTGEELSAWLAIAAVLGAFARLNYLLFPSLYSEWVYTGDLMRLGFFGVLCVGAAREIARSQRAGAEAAVLEDRRRLARDIHDGLAQELAFIATHAQRLGPGTADRPEEQSLVVAQMRDAAQRALEESRTAIDVLTLPPDQNLADAVCRAAEHVGERYGARIRTRLDESIDVPHGVRDAMIRIVREAVNNAVRHGGARVVEIELSGPHPLLLTVRDDGSGFDRQTVGRGFGLTSMRERTKGIGGEMTIESAPGAGTVVEVRVP